MEEEFLSDFNNLCRFCLRTEEEMTDLFETGIYDVVMSTTRLQLSSSNNLPRNICRECKRQTEEIYRFVSLVRSSNDRLLCSVTKNKEETKETGDFDSREETAKEAVPEQKEEEEEELFLVMVPGNVEALSSSDHTYPKETPLTRGTGETEPDSSDRSSIDFENWAEFLSLLRGSRPGDGKSVFPKCPICGFEEEKTFFLDHLRIHEKEGIDIFKLNGRTDDWKIVFKIDLDGRKCKKCRKLFESEKKLLRHARESHGIVSGKGRKLEVTYECPVCRDRYIDDPADFLRHLSGHGKGDVRFVKVNNSGIPVPVKKTETGTLLSAREIGGTFEKVSLESCRVSTPEADFPIFGKNKSPSEFFSGTYGAKRRIMKNLKKHLTFKERVVSPDPEKLLPDSRPERVPRNGTLISSETSGKEFSDDSGSVSKKRNSSRKRKTCSRKVKNKKCVKSDEHSHSDPNVFKSDISRLPLPSLTRLMECHSEIHRHNRPPQWESNVSDFHSLSGDGPSLTGHPGDRKASEPHVSHDQYDGADKFRRDVKRRPNYKTTECSLCGKRLSTSQSLRLHTKRHFEADGILCPECGKSFFEERNYRRHLLTHRGIRPHLCDYPGCGKSFYTLFEIKRHKKYHFDTRDFPCSYCTKKFHESNHLKVHTRTHTGEKPYVCPHCPKGFVTRTRCKQHIKLIHRGEGYDLIQTDISKKVPVFRTFET